MSRDTSPEHVLRQLAKGKLSPVYLFYGTGEFRLEKVLNRIRNNFIPESARDLNLQVFYGDKDSPADIIDEARSLPFLSENRLIIVRRLENFSAQTLKTFIPYIEQPVESTCLIFVSEKPKLQGKFYTKLGDMGAAINFQELRDNQIVPWLLKTAKDMGFTMAPQACDYLKQIVGKHLRDLHSEMEKLYLCYGEANVGVEEVRELAVRSRAYTIFELIDEISSRRRAESIAILNRFMDEEKDGALRVIGMLNRQVRLLWQAVSIIRKGGKSADVASSLRLMPFLAKKVVAQSKNWSEDDLEQALHLLYKADGHLKSGLRGRLIIENLVLSLCNSSMR